MSLFSAINVARNALIAAQVGLQVTGNNIANAGTPGYIRSEAVLAPAPTQRVGDLLLGLGVDVTAIVQKVDLFLEERLRGANSDLASGETQENTYLQLEAVLAELGDTDLSSTLSNFFGSIHDVLNQPESTSVRNLATLQGQAVADAIRRIDSRVRELRSDVNDRVIDAADDINRLLEKIAKLNVQIVTVEGGGATPSDAIGLRDERQNALAELSRLIDIRAVEQKSGSVTVFSGGDFLVFEGSFRGVKVETVADRGLTAAEIRLEATDAKLQTNSGEVAGLLTSRDDVLGGFLDDLNDFARALAFEFNKVYSQGQGLKGYSSLASEFAVDDVQAALDVAGLPYTPVNGSFEVQIRNKQTGLTQTTDIFVHLNGLDDDTTLDDLAGALNAIDGLTATITPARKLSLSVDSPNLEFAFAGDNSGTLAALGLNTFFTGISSSDLGVSSLVRSDPALFAASRGGIGEDTQIAEQLAAFIDAPLESHNGASLADLYDRLAGQTSQGASAARAVAEAFRVFQRTLQGQQLSISGVSVDEEAIRMITYQRMFQAAAKFITTINELLEDLVRL